MDKQQLEQHIDQFINNEMSPSERQEFCRNLEINKKLKQQVELRMLLIEAELIRAEKKAKLAMRGAEHTTIRPWMAVASIIFILITSLYLANPYSYSPQDIYQIYYEIPPIERMRGTGLPERVALYNQQIINAFEQQQYKEIVKLYEKKHLVGIICDFPVSTRLYLSIALMEQQKETKAISLLGSLNTTPYQEEAEWLLLCCYMKTNKRDEALQLIQTIKSHNGLYVKKASLMEKLLKEKKWF